MHYKNYKSKVNNNRTERKSVITTKKKLNFPKVIDPSVIYSISHRLTDADCSYTDVEIFYRKSQNDSERL